MGAKEDKLGQGLLELVAGRRPVDEDLGQIGVYPDPVAERPGKQTEYPVTHNLFPVPYLILVKREATLKLPKELLNAPAGLIDGDDLLVR